MELKIRVKKTVQQSQTICETVSFVYISLRVKANIIINPLQWFKNLCLVQDYQGQTYARATGNRTW
jgi:hypothetical protein